jgi:hypothetical protein
VHHPDRHPIGLLNAQREDGNIPRMHGHGPDDQKFRLTLESVRQDLVDAVHAWRAQGGSDDDLALLIDAQHPGKPHVATSTRKQLELTIPDFDPTIAIEFARNIPGQVPAVVDLHDFVRRVIWIDLTPPYTW